jgi:hypothetical protein
MSADTNLNFDLIPFPWRNQAKFLVSDPLAELNETTNLKISNPQDVSEQPDSTPS